MPDHANVELVRRGYEAFDKGDMQTVDALFADDIVWHNGSRGPLAGTLTSKKEVFEFFGKLAELSGGTFRIEVHDVVGGDDHVVVLSTGRATRNGQALDTQGSDIMHVRGGQVVEFWHLEVDPYRSEEFWA
jgi:ketosteroid isomerase-like protein